VGGTRTISVSEEAYERLRSAKMGNESFTDVIFRLTGHRSLLEFVGLLSREEGEDVEKAIAAIRERSRARLKGTRS
jgi:predicted CopG family antitoxin